MKAVDWQGFILRHFRKAIIPCTFILICILLLFFVFVPVLSNINAKKSLIMKKELELRELVSLCREYKELKTFNEQMDKMIYKNGPNFELLSFLEEIAKKAGIIEKISSMQPSKGESDEISATLVLKDLNMDELTSYINQVMNSGKVLAVKKMQLKASDKAKRSLEASLVFSTIKSLHPNLPS